MATDSVLTKTQPEFLCPKANNDIWIVESPQPPPFVELTLHSGSQGNLSLASETPSRVGSSYNKSDKNDTNLFPAILDFRRSTTKTNSFGLLSEGFYNDTNLDSAAVADKEENGMSSVKSIEDGCIGKDMTLNSHTHKPVKRKHRKSKKKSQQSPVLKRSQTTSHLLQSPGSADGASKLNVRVTAQGNITADLNILTAQCRAVKIHQHFESKSKTSGGHGSFHSKRINFVAKPTDLSHQNSVSKSTNYITESQYSKGENPRKYYSSTSSSPEQLIRKSLAQTESVYLQRVTKVYLSEKHSGVIKEEGKEFPCAPPATPTPEQLKRYEYVPSLNDVRSQRAVRQKLQVMERKEQQREEKRREEQARLDRIHQKDKESELRRRQRQEIYALNKIMTELEHKRFLEFCKTKGINP